MSIPIERYLSLIRKELSTSLMPDDDNARRIAVYILRVLNQMLARIDTLPALRLKAIAELDGLLDELNGEMRSIEGAMVLTGDLTRHIRAKPNFEMLEPVLQRVVRVLLGHPSETGKALLKRIMAILSDMEAALDKVTRGNEALHEARQEEKLPPLDDAKRQALESYLRKRFDEPAIQIDRIKAVAGGGSKITLIIELLHAQRLPESIVLRGDHFGGIVESSVIDEYPILQIVYEAGVPVPRPLAAESDKSIIGAAFILVSRVDGVNNGDHISIYEPGREFGLDLARAVGRLHAIPAAKYGGKVSGATTSTLEFVKRDMAVFESIWRNSDQPSVAIEMGYAWLKDHLHFADGPRTLIHRDIACHNMLAKDGKLTAILDWETTTIGNPAQDLGYLYRLVTQMMPWEDFLEEYEKAGGKRPSAEELDFYLLWTLIWSVTFMLVARSFFHAGIADSAVLAYGTQHLWQRANCDLHQLLNRIIERY